MPGTGKVPEGMTIDHQPLVGRKPSASRKEINDGREGERSNPRVWDAKHCFAFMPHDVFYAHSLIPIVLFKRFESQQQL